MPELNAPTRADGGAFVSIQRAPFSMSFCHGYQRALARRVDQLSEHLTLDRRRLIAWAIAHNMLSAWWSVEDHGSGWEAAVAVAQMLSDLERGAR